MYDHTLTEEEAAAVEAVKGCELHQVSRPLRHATGLQLLVLQVIGIAETVCFVCACLGHWEVDDTAEPVTSSMQCVTLPHVWLDLSRVEPTQVFPDLLLHRWRP